MDDKVSTFSKQYKMDSIKMFCYIKITMHILFVITLSNTLQAKSNMIKIHNNTNKTNASKSKLKQSLVLVSYIKGVKKTSISFFSEDNKVSTTPIKVMPSNELLNKKTIKVVNLLKNDSITNIVIYNKKIRLLFKIPPYKTLLGKNHQQRYNLLLGFYESNSSFQTQKYHTGLEQLFREMKAFAKQNRDQGMLDEIDFMTLYYKSVTLSANENIVFLESAHLDALKDGTPWKIFLTKWYLSQVLKGDRSKIAQVLYLQTEASEMLENGFEHPSAAYLNYMLANANYSYSDMKLAKKYYRRAIKFADSEASQATRSRCFNEMGLVYRKLNQLDSSDVFLKKALSISLKHSDSIMECIISGNLGENQYLRHHYEEAIPLLQKDADMAMRGSETGLASNALLLLADCYLMLGNRSKSTEMLTLGREYAYKSNQYARLKTLYPILSKWNAIEGQGELAAMYLDSTRLVTDSLQRIEMLLKVVPTEELYKLSNLELNKEEQKLEIANRKLTIALMFIVLCVMVISFLSYRAFIQRKQKRITSENVQLKTDLLQAQQKLDSFLLLKSNSIAVESDISNKPISTEQDLQRFKELFDAAHLGFRQGLKYKYPILTDSENLLLCLLKLNLSNKEIASLLGVGINAVQQQQRRARVKLSLNTVAELRTVAQNS